ncbi:MAG TPA: zinc ABC transporter solute-binding protein [Desulfuromonadales bacterium]|nr:zinc ABC transporter solute-binding protein [Desulfuromonadales bacterium]
MKNILLTLLITISMVAPANAAIKVVATLPWIGSIAKDIGQNKVTVTTLIKSSQDPHSIEAKPSMIAAMRQADIAMYNGLDLEVGYLPILIESSKNPAIQTGKAGNFNASVYVDAIEKPSVACRCNGDVHPLGNPHYHLSPKNIKKVVIGMGDSLAGVDHVNAAFYKANAAAFVKKVEQKQKEWAGRQLKKKPFFAQHKFFEYLAGEYGFLVLAYLEEKPGIPPSSAHIERLIANAAMLHPRAILTTDYHGPGQAKFFSSKTGVKTVVVPHDVGAAGTRDWFSLMDAVFKALEEA